MVRHLRPVRVALMMLDGNRTAYGFPPVAPFNCRWKEAMGANQTGYAMPSGSTASALQLECGDYGPVRFHLRLFPFMSKGRSITNLIGNSVATVGVAAGKARRAFHPA